MLRIAKRRFSSSFLLGQRFFTKDHEWIQMKDKIGTFGITDYAQKALGDVVYIEIPTIGDNVAQHDQIGAVESVKAASDIYSPVSGSVVAVNETLEDSPSLINSSPYDKGWIARIEVADISQLDKLMKEPEYNSYVGTLE